MKKIILNFAFIIFSAGILSAQVTQINSNKSLEVTFPLSNNKTIVVSKADSSVWATDGTAVGTIQLSPDIKFEEDYSVVSGKMVFRGSTPATGSEIYSTDGTVAGTFLVSDIFAGTTGSNPEDLVLFNGAVYFSAVTANEGRELWRTDGIPGDNTHTHIVKDILTGPGGSLDIPAAVSLNFGPTLFPNGSYLLFAAKTPASGIELFKSDGTEGGTGLLKDISAMADSSNPHFFFKYNDNIVLFVATDTAHGQEIWKTDGTVNGTVILKDINPGPSNSTSLMVPFVGLVPVFQGFHLFNNRVYFNAVSGTDIGELWSSDGTEGNTVLLKNIEPGVSSLSFIAGAINFPNKIIFSFSDFNNRSELWESDGTPAGTKLFKSFVPANQGDVPQIILPYNFDFTNQTLTQPLFQGNKFFFTITTETDGNELWISDGIDSTLAHTHLVKDINPGAGDGVTSGGSSYVFTSTELFFAANNNVDGNELWRSDGTEGGTSIVANIYPFIGNSDPELPFFIANGKIIFGADNGDAPPGNTDLYVLDGNFTPLPVTLSEFTVTLKAKDALLQWTTLNESNTKDFIIQRSFDGQHFANIGTVPAANNSAAKRVYSYADADISISGKNIVYYRILATDKDGKSTSTNVILVKIKGTTQWMVRLLSNPVQNYVNLMLSDITRDLKLSVKDMSGKTFYTSLRQNINGQISIPVANLQRGLYIIIAETNDEKKTIKFIKQ